MLNGFRAESTLESEAIDVPSFSLDSSLFLSDLRVDFCGRSQTDLYSYRVVYEISNVCPDINLNLRIMFTTSTTHLML